MKRALLMLAVAALIVPASALATNSLDVNAAAAMQGTFGLQVLFDGSTNNAYVEDQSPNAETIYHFSFIASRSTWVPTSTAQFYVLTGRHGDPATTNSIRFYVRENPTAPGTYHARALARTDAAGFVQVGCGNFGTGNQTYDVVWTASTGPGNNNGTLTCLRNGAVPPGNTAITIDNDTMRVDAVRFGLFNTSPAGATAAGSYNLDEFISTRTP